MTTTTTEVRDYRVEGAVTALSSVAHGGDHAGTVQHLRRERIVQPDGTVAEVPVVSGNAVRGILRDYSAELLWRHLGEPALDTAVFHALWSGGALAKAGAGHVLSSHQLRDLRALVPHVALFGAAGGGRIIEGKLLIGKLVPIVAETAHVVPADLVPEMSLSIWELLQIEEFTRSDDAKRGRADRQLGRGAAGTLDVDTETMQAPAQQMRYGVETIPAGTRFHWWVALRGVTPLEAGCFAAAMRSWSQAGSHIGGRSATGHGRLRVDAAGWEHPVPALTTGGDLPDLTDDLAVHTRDHRDDIIEALSWLG